MWGGGGRKEIKGFRDFWEQSFCAQIRKRSSSEHQKKSKSRAKAKEGWVKGGSIYSVIDKQS